MIAKRPVVPAIFLRLSFPDYGDTMAGRAGVTLTLDDFDRIARTVPVLANVRPGGRTYLMEDFHFAGGLPGFLSRIPDLLHLDRPTVTHDSLREQLAGARVHHDDVIRPRENPVASEGGVAVLRGNLCPDGAVIKHIAAEPRLLRHTGPAVVFESEQDAYHGIVFGKVKAGDVVVIRYEGPRGGPGMQEMLAPTTAIKGVGLDDQCALITDGRFSGGTAGASIGHISPEAAVGGPLALIRDGDIIEIDIPARRLSVRLSDEELAARRAAWTPPAPRYSRGWLARYAAMATSADTGAVLRLP